MRRISGFFILSAMAAGAVLTAYALHAQEQGRLSRPISLQLPTVAPVPGAHVRATFLIKVKWLHESGSTETLYGLTRVARDSRGRTWRELRELGSSPEANPPAGIVLVDPKTSIRKILDPIHNTVVEQRFRPSSHQPSDRNDVRVEDLGSKTIDGFNATGTRRIWFLPGQITDAGVPAEVFDETWYSPDLQMIVSERRTDLLGATVEVTMSEVDRHEPSPSLFKTPHGYRLPSSGQVRVGTGTWSVAAPDQEGNITGAW